MNDNNNEETVIDLSQLFGAVRKSIVDNPYFTYNDTPFS